jgi:hypothetical protein
MIRVVRQAKEQSTKNVFWRMVQTLRNVTNSLETSKIFQSDTGYTLSGHDLVDFFTSLCPGFQVLLCPINVASRISNLHMSV